MLLVKVISCSVMSDACDSMDYIQQAVRLSVHGASVSRTLKCHLPPPGDLYNLGDKNPALLHYSWILYRLSHQEF